MSVRKPVIFLLVMKKSFKFEEEYWMALPLKLVRYNFLAIQLGKHVAYLENTEKSPRIKLQSNWQYSFCIHL